MKLIKVLSEVVPIFVGLLCYTDFCGKSEE